jgi:hypothetical protein
VKERFILHTQTGMERNKKQETGISNICEGFSFVY